MEAEVIRELLDLKSNRDSRSRGKPYKLGIMTLFKDHQKLLITTDGGSRGNPGPAAFGVTIAGKGYGEFLGIRTNNYAEYAGIDFALKKARSLLGKTKAKQTEVEVRMDSELAMKQLTGVYKVQDPDIQKFFMEIWNTKLDFKKVSFMHIPREENKAADREVNRVLDEQMGR